MTMSATSNQPVLLACLHIPFLAAAEVRPHTSGAVAENSEVYSLTVSGIQLPVERIREGHHARFAFSSPVEVLVRIPDPVASFRQPGDLSNRNGQGRPGGAVRAR